MKLAGLLVASLLCIASSGVHAQSAQAKSYFEAGAGAYAAGDYQAAVQAFDAAYRLQPLAAIAFSLAQAERRQYFVSQDLAHLTRAIELYRAYLADVPTGGRRADATDALGQLEPIALARSSEQTDGAALHTEQSPRQTRLMVRCQAPNARIALDAGESVPAPLIAETTPGPHHVLVEAPGFFSAQQEVTTVAGELVPIEVALRERPALVIVKARDGAEVYVDGVSVNLAAPGESVSLRAGTHLLAFAKKGHRLYDVSLALERGETREIVPKLHRTGQRVAAITLFVVTGVSLATGAVFTGSALSQESRAHDLERARYSHAITPAERAEYADTVIARDRSRIAAIFGLALGASALLAGLLLYQLDDPDPRQVAPHAAVRVEVTPAAGLGVRLGLVGRM